MSKSEYRRMAAQTSDRDALEKALTEMDGLRKKLALANVEIEHLNNEVRAQYQFAEEARVELDFVEAALNEFFKRLGKDIPKKGWLRETILRVSRRTSDCKDPVHDDRPAALQSDTGKVAEAREKVIEAARECNTGSNRQVRGIVAALAAYDAALRGGEGR